MCFSSFQHLLKRRKTLRRQKLVRDQRNTPPPWKCLQNSSNLWYQKLKYHREKLLGKLINNILRPFKVDSLVVGHSKMIPNFYRAFNVDSLVCRPFHGDSLVLRHIFLKANQGQSHFFLFYCFKNDEGGVILIS